MDYQTNVENALGIMREDLDGIRDELRGLQRLMILLLVRKPHTSDDDLWPMIEKEARRVGLPIERKS